MGKYWVVCSRTWIITTSAKSQKRKNIGLFNSHTWVFAGSAKPHNWEMVGMENSSIWEENGTFLTHEWVWYRFPNFGKSHVSPFFPQNGNLRIFPVSHCCAMTIFLTILQFNYRNIIYGRNTPISPFALTSFKEILDTCELLSCPEKQQNKGRHFQKNQQQ